MAEPKAEHLWCVASRGRGGRLSTIHCTLANTRQDAIRLFLAEFPPATEPWEHYERNLGYEVVKVTLSEGWN